MSTSSQISLAYTQQGIGRAFASRVRAPTHAQPAPTTSIASERLRLTRRAWASAARPRGWSPRRWPARPLCPSRATRARRPQWPAARCKGGGRGSDVVVGWHLVEAVGGWARMQRSNRGCRAGARASERKKERKTSARHQACIKGALIKEDHRGASRCALRSHGPVLHTHAAALP
jgi:hypothetical protein